MPNILWTNAYEEFSKPIYAKMHEDYNTCFIFRNDASLKNLVLKKNYKLFYFHVDLFITQIQARKNMEMQVT